jgi:hypothetical protein
MALSKEQAEWIHFNCHYKYGQFLGDFTNIPQEWATEEFYIEAVRETARVLEHIPEAWKTEAVCLEAVRKDKEGAMKFVPKALKSKVKGA